MANSQVPPPIPISLPTGGLTWLDRVFLLIILGAAPAGVLMIAVWSGPPFPVDFLSRAVTALAIVGVAGLLLLESTSIRRVKIDLRGVTFCYLLHKEFGSWASLNPYTTPIEHGLWGFARSREGRRPGFERGHLVTLGQAKAILLYPAAPEWTIRPDVAARLGVAMPPS
jgi:hypothetical protein